MHFSVCLPLIVLYYAPSIFAALGQSSNTTSLLATGVVGVAMFLATIPAVMYVDKLGRKPVMIVGGTGMFLCHFIIAIIFAKNQDQWSTHKAAGWAAVVMVWLFVINFGYSWGPCAWVLISEVWPLSNRAYGIAIGASANWMSNFIVGQITPDMIKHLKYGTFIFFGLLTFGGVLFVWFVVPETKRLSLEEMDVIFGAQGVAQAVSYALIALTVQLKTILINYCRTTNGWLRSAVKSALTLRWLGWELSTRIRLCPWNIHRMGLETREWSRRWKVEPSGMKQTAVTDSQSVIKLPA